MQRGRIKDVRRTEETVAWLTDQIGHICSRPEMYAQSKLEIDEILMHLHSVLGYMLGRENELRQRASRHICKTESSRMPRGWATRGRTREQLQPVADFWLQLDRKLGIEIPPRRSP